MVKGIIFDLDQTLVDSSCAEPHRKQRNWQAVYPLIPKFILYHGFQEVFTFVKEHRVRCCIVTSSPGVYTKRVISHFNIPCEFVVDYFSTAKRKPDPEPMIKALELLRLNKDEVISLGDRAIDVISSNSALIKSVACLWGTNEKEAVLKSNPSLIIKHPLDILTILNK